MKIYSGKGKKLIYIYVNKSTKINPILVKWGIKDLSEIKRPRNVRIHIIGLISIKIWTSGTITAIISVVQ